MILLILIFRITKLELLILKSIVNAMIESFAKPSFALIQRYTKF